MTKLILLLLLSLLVLTGCYKNCHEGQELSSGSYLIINGYWSSQTYNNADFTNCCCDSIRNPDVCVCGNLESKGDD